MTDNTPDKLKTTEEGQADIGFVSVPTWYNRGVFGHSAERAGCNVPLDVKWGMRECQTCGLFQKVPVVLEKGELVECARCGHHLARQRRTMPFQGPLAFCFANAAIYLALLLVPILRLNIRGRINTATLLTGPSYLAHHGFGSIATLVYLTSAVMPGCIIALLTAVLLGSRCKTLPRWATVALVWFERLTPWSMSGIYMIGLIVAYTKLVDLAVVKILPGAWLLLALMIGIAAMESVFNVDLIWRHRSIDGESAHIVSVHTPPSHMLSCSHCHLVLASKNKVHPEADMGDCPRCGQILRKRKANSMERCGAFLLAAIVCYLPANIYPVMTYTRLGKGTPNTIIGGVKELWQYHLYALALIVLLASITVPVLKILSLLWMLIEEKRRTHKHIVFLTYLYRFVARIGRWSMIDVFMISILVGLVRFGFFAQVLPDKGVVFFALVVILTIVAADLYDPRGMWDAAGLNRDSKIAEHEQREIHRRQAEEAAAKAAKKR